MGTAGGKIILCGEHAVVHGGDALVVGLERGVTATATASTEWRLSIDGKALTNADASLEALTRVGRHLGSNPATLDLQVRMPLGVGLGGSAAMAVAVARALGELHGNPLPDADAFAAAQIWERVFHGNPSGVDAAAATYGGCMLYNRERFANPTPDVVASARVGVGTALHIALAVAGPPSLTKTMVERVAERKSLDPRAFSDQFDAIQRIVACARVCVESGDHRKLGALLTQNHEHLAAWDLSTPEIERARKLALAHGAFGAKLTGAGGGGCVLAVCPETALDDVLAALEAGGFATLSAVVPPSPADSRAH